MPVESGDGYASGTIVSSDEIELIYGNGNEPICVAINPLKRR